MKFKLNLSGLAPMSLTKGPPLPKALKINWPWRPHFLDFLPAVVLSESKARANPCKCFTDPSTGKEHCFAKGAIGMLTQDQAAELCVAGKTSASGGAGISARWKRMRKQR